MIHCTVGPVGTDNTEASLDEKTKIQSVLSLLNFENSFLAEGTEGLVVALPHEGSQPADFDSFEKAFKFFSDWDSKLCDTPRDTPRSTTSIASSCGMSVVPTEYYSPRSAVVDKTTDSIRFTQVSPLLHPLLVWILTFCLTATSTFKSRPDGHAVARAST